HIDNLDSKMECMRSVLNRDRRVDGCWTGYNSTLDRSILKKLKFLEAHPDRPEGANTTGESTSATGALTTPRGDAAPHMSHRREPQPLSSFAQKLQGALRSDS